jgi:hypothetical protein
MLLSLLCLGSRESVAQNDLTDVGVLRQSTEHLRRILKLARTHQGTSVEVKFSLSQITALTSEWRVITQ